MDKIVDGLRICVDEINWNYNQKHIDISAYKIMLIGYKMGLVAWISDGNLENEEKENMKEFMVYLEGLIDEGKDRTRTSRKTHRD